MCTTGCQVLAQCLWCKEITINLNFFHKISNNSQLNQFRTVQLLSRPICVASADSEHFLVMLIGAIKSDLPITLPSTTVCKLELLLAS